MRNLIPVSIFAVAMAFFEAAVVVYLRELYYPGGFDFPIQTMDESIAWVEIIREAFSLIMLVSVGYLAGRKALDRFAWFIFSFAIWDIFYYVFLKLALGWPESLLTWDILFLIPTVWSGPVIAPILTSISMILLALVILHRLENTAGFKVSGRSWAIIIAGAILIFTSFIWDYCHFALDMWQAGNTLQSPLMDIFEDLSLKYVPDRFNWPVYITGELVIATGIYFVWSKKRKNK